MPNLKPLKDPITSQQIHWIAGILEGEGCFFGGWSGGINIRLVMTDKDVVDRVADFFGSKVSISDRTKKLPQWKEAYKTQVGGLKAAQWMMIIYSLMGIRRKEKIEELLKIWKSKPVWGIKTSEKEKQYNKLYYQKNKDKVLERTKDRYNAQEVSVVIGSNSGICGFLPKEGI